MDKRKLPTRFHRKRAERFQKRVKQAQKSATQVASFGIVAAGSLSKDEGERVTQTDILSQVDIGSATKRFDIKIAGGPYVLDYSRNGRFMAYCGKSGNIAAFDWLTKRILFESNVAHNCKDITFLHQETLIAVAEPTYTSIYDNQGIEVHCLKQLNRVLRLEFLPYHFLLVASAENGFLTYLDCTTGTVVSSLPTFNGRLAVMCQNPSNGIILTGHNNGSVSMWVPTEKSSVVKMFTHHSGLTTLACDRSGRYLATCALDRKLKIWDIRSTYDPLSEINLPVSATTACFSQRGLLALGCGTTVQVFEKPHLGLVEKRDTVEIGVPRKVLSTSYLSHFAVRPVHQVQFCPYEDVLGLGTNGGISSILCPGSAEPNYDALEENPFANKKYRQEREVRRLLDKIPHTMISLDSQIGKIRREDILDEWEKKKAALLGEPVKVPMPSVKKNKQKGGSKPSRLEARKQEIRFERKMFTIQSALGVQETAKSTSRNPDSNLSDTSKPSEQLISKKRLAKRRLNSALDVLIPTAE